MPQPQLITRAVLLKALKALRGEDGSLPGNKALAEFLSKELNRPVSVHAVNRAKRREGLARTYLRLTGPGKFVPWKINPEDDDTTELQYLRVLGALAAGQMRGPSYVKRAVHWARNTVDAGLDIRYVKDNPPGQRWEYFKAEEESYLQARLDEAKRGLTELLKRREQGSP